MPHENVGHARHVPGHHDDRGHGGDTPGHGKTYSVIVNGRPRTITEHKLSYIEAVHLAYPGEQPSDTVLFTVSYSNPHGKDGSLVAGQETVIHDGMILNVHRTDRS
jgi:hypothetical protein